MTPIWARLPQVISQSIMYHMFHCLRVRARAFGVHQGNLPGQVLIEQPCRHMQTHAALVP